jgi:hypothetical protein
LGDLASSIFGSTTNDSGQVRRLRHDLAVVDDAKDENGQRQKRHQQRELDRNGAAVRPAVSPSE